MVIQIPEAVDAGEGEGDVGGDGEGAEVVV